MCLKLHACAGLQKATDVANAYISPSMQSYVCMSLQLPTMQDCANWSAY